MILPATATTVLHTVSTSAVPRHTNEEATIVTKVGGPVVLAVGLESKSMYAPHGWDGKHSYQQGLDVFLETVIVEALEGLGVVKVAGQRITLGVVLAEDVEPQLIGPPVTVLAVVSAHVALVRDDDMLCRDAVLPSDRHRRCWPSGWGTWWEPSLQYCPLWM